MSAQPRYPMVDALRGLAIVMMLSFHFSYDLSYFRFVQWNFYSDPFWLHYRSVILSTFLVVVGISLWLAHHHAIQWRSARQRLLLLLANAALVSLGSYLLFKQRFIAFGILHFIAVASVCALPWIRRPWLALCAGLGLIVVGNTVQLPLFDHPWLHWIGLMTHKPASEDYVPLLPWLGVVYLGIFLGHAGIGWEFFPPLARWRVGSGFSRSLGWMGRHSLLIYMVHQPLLMGVLYLLNRIVVTP
ncbi:MAG: DUF1624 domain-containing protein [Gammaproteobacteria bacterium]|nr:DUF1624 domain-containing protein [Gammaproteobacteria bacterium]